MALWMIRHRTNRAAVERMLNQSDNEKNEDEEEPAEMEITGCP
jgi:hypothetical protein